MGQHTVVVVVVVLAKARQYLPFNLDYFLRLSESEQAAGADSRLESGAVT